MSQDNPSAEVDKASFFGAFLGTFFWVSFVLVLSFLAAFTMGGAVLRANEYVMERQKTAAFLHAISSTLKDAETGQRGYIITGNEAFLAPYQAAADRINQQVSQLNRNSGDDFAASDLDTLQQLIDEKMRELRATIRVRREQGLEAAIAIVSQGDGRRVMERANAHIDSLIEHETELTREAQLGSKRLSNVRTTVFGLATFLSLFVIIRAYRRIDRETKVRETQARAIADQRELLEVTLRSIGDAVIVTDTESRITFMNRVATDLTGWTLEEAIGQPCASVFQIINEDTREPVESPVEKVLRMGIIVGLANHTLLIRKDGSEVPIDDSGAPIRDSEQNIRGVVLIFRDFSEHKATEKSLMTAKDDAESANRAKDNFLASLSHELRTPLTPIAATLAAWETNPVVPKDLLPQVQLMRRNVDLEARLIDDLLDLTRIVQGKLSLNSEVADLHDLITATTDMYQSDIQGKRLQVRLKLDALRHHSYADPARMQQIFWNILKNATKFTPKHGLIEIESTNLSDGRIAVSFRDSGIGMSPDTLEKLFQPFEQGADEMVRRAGGLGLGMAISQALVGAQNGTIEAHSDGPGKGSTFTVTVPTVEPPVPTSNAKAESPRPEGRSCRVLMVEDHPDTADVMALLLRQFGHSVRVAQTVADALVALSEEKFDILVSDVGLPDGTGVDLIREVRSTYGPEMPAIALTGFGMEEDIARTREAGFNEHLTKPVNSQRLEIYIQKLTAPKG